MKTPKALYSIVALLIFLYSCTTTTTTVYSTRSNGKVPPGQMKKMTGAKSAKSYAPGQQKQTRTSSSNGNSNGNSKGHGNGNSKAPGKNRR